MKGQDQDQVADVTAKPATTTSAGGASSAALTANSTGAAQQQQKRQGGSLWALWGALAQPIASKHSDTAQPQQAEQQQQQHQHQSEHQQQHQHQQQQTAPAVDAVKGPWDATGFAWRKLDPKFAATVFNSTGDARRQLQIKMMAEEPVDGHLSLDHVHETAKRMAGGYTGMLIAMGASGLVTGYWNVFSTSLKDVETQLQQLDQNQRVKHGQVGSAV